MALIASLTAVAASPEPPTTPHDGIVAPHAATQAVTKLTGDPSGPPWPRLTMSQYEAVARGTALTTSDHSRLELARSLPHPIPTGVLEGLAAVLLSGCVTATGLSVTAAIAETELCFFETAIIRGDNNLLGASRSR